MQGANDLIVDQTNRTWVYNKTGVFLSIAMNHTEKRFFFFSVHDAKSQRSQIRQWNLSALYLNPKKGRASKTKIYRLKSKKNSIYVECNKSKEIITQYHFCSILSTPIYIS